MVVTVDLFRPTNLGFDLDSVRPLFATKEDRDTYFDSHIGIGEIGAYAWVNPGDPITVSKFMEVVRGCTIGRLNVDPKAFPEYHEKYYFKVVSLEEVGDGKTRIYPAIDWELTHLVDYKEAYITKCPLDQPYASSQERGVTKYYLKDTNLIEDQGYIVMVLTQMKSDEGKDYVDGPYYIYLDVYRDGMYPHDVIAEAISAGLFTAKDVIGAYLTLYNPNELGQRHIKEWHDFPPRWEERGLKKLGIYTNNRCSALLLSDDHGFTHDRITDLNQGLISGFADGRGNVLYNIPYGVKFTSYRLHTQLSGAGCSTYVTLNAEHGYSEFRYVGPAIQGFTFTIPAQSLDLVSNEWKEYSFRQRELDIKSRHAAEAQGLISSMMNPMTILSTVMGGSVFSGKGIGGKKGMMEAGSANIISAVVNAGIGYVAGNAEQDRTDMRYKMMPNQAQIVGSGNAFDINQRYGLFHFTLEADPDSLARIKNENVTVGVPANGFVLDMKAKLTEDLAKGDMRPWAFAPMLSMVDMPEDQKEMIQTICALPHRWKVVK